MPLHHVYLETKGFTGLAKVAVRPALLVSGVSFILGNYIACSEVFSLPEVVYDP